MPYYRARSKDIAKSAARRVQTIAPYFQPNIIGTPNKSKGPTVTGRKRKYRQNSIKTPEYTVRITVMELTKLRHAAAGC